MTVLLFLLGRFPDFDNSFDQRFKPDTPCIEKILTLALPKRVHIGFQFNEERHLAIFRESDIVDVV